MKRPVYHKSKEKAQLFIELRKRVMDRYQSLPKTRDNSIRFKAIFLPILYFGLFVFAQFNAHNPLIYILSYFLMGMSLVLIYLNVIHEAAHGNIFNQKWANDAVLFVFDLVGANSYIWRKRHVFSHHSFPNIDGWDTDIEQSGIIAIYPHQEINSIQKYQHIFCFFLYPVYLFNWLVVRDFRDFFDQNRVIRKTGGTIPTIEKVKLILFKTLYFTYQLIIPIALIGVNWKLAVLAWFIQVASASIFALFVLLPLHPLAENEYPLPDENGNLPFDWMTHMLETTNDLTHKNWFVRNVLGNFSYHVAHHLFPNISYVYYDEITEEVAKFSEEHQLNYKAYPLPKALQLHHQQLKTNAMSVYHILEE